MRFKRRSSHHGLRFAECHVRLDNLQHMRGDLIHVLNGPDTECHDRSVVLKQEDKDSVTLNSVHTVLCYTLE